MDFSLSSEQRMFQQTVVDFAKAELDHDPEAGFPASAWARCAGLGLLGLPISPQYGGSDADAVSTIAALEGLGYGCADNGLIFSLNAHLWAATAPIMRFGSPAQRQHYLPAMCDGTLIASHAMSEPESGSDAFALRTTARPDGEGYRLTGSKTFVTNAPVAGLFLIFATTDAARGFAGLGAFLVDRDAPGLTVGDPLQKMGLHASPMAEVYLDDCPAQPLGPAGAGMPIFTWAMERERSFILAAAVGTMRRHLERSVDHARQRRQFGRPIGGFQAVSHRLVDMRLRLDTARLLLYRLGWLIDTGQPFALDSALVKLHLSQCFIDSGMDAVQLHGGYGYLAEYGLERDLRDAIAARLYSGTSEIMHNLAAQLMGLR